ncbi:MAG: Ada metal-binding domain-containing protein [Mucilaginibacter sp.]
MIAHAELGDTAFQRSRTLKTLIDAGDIQLAGNRKLKIFGTINCFSGKRMKTANRVFFGSADEAQRMGYRPCGHCMREAYLQWKALS